MKKISNERVLVIEKDDYDNIHKETIAYDFSILIS